MATDTQLEREYYIRKIASATVSSQTTLSQLQRRYWASVVGAGVGSNMTLEQLQKAWLYKEIANRGGTPTGGRVSDLWKTLVSAISQTPSVRQEENKRLFFKFAS